jgi:hypothetical protein
MNETSASAILQQLGIAQFGATLLEFCDLGKPLDLLVDAPIPRKLLDVPVDVPVDLTLSGKLTNALVYHISRSGGSCLVGPLPLQHLSSSL